MISSHEVRSGSNQGFGGAAAGMVPATRPRAFRSFGASTTILWTGYAFQISARWSMGPNIQLGMACSLALSVLAEHPNCPKTLHQAIEGGRGPRVAIPIGGLAFWTWPLRFRASASSPVSEASLARRRPFTRDAVHILLSLSALRLRGDRRHDDLA